MTEKRVFVEPSQAGPTHKLVPNKDGTTHVIPGKAHEAQEGAVLNPGVKTVATAQSGPQCPMCHSSGTLRMHPKQPEGKRIYCTNKDCTYDQSRQHSGITEHDRPDGVGRTSGVRVLRQSGPNN